MRRFKLIALLGLLLFINQMLFAQSYRSDDPQDVVEFLGLGWSWGVERNSKPFLEAGVGVGQLGHYEFGGTFYLNGLAEAKFGYSASDSFTTGVIRLKENYFVGSWLQKDLNYFIEEEEPDYTEMEMKRIGFGVRRGYGYNLGALKILPYVQNSFMWSRMESIRPDGLSEEDIALLDRYEDDYRFNFVNETGLKIRLFGSLEAMASYEYAIVYPRVIFWEWLGSYTIMYMSMGIISSFASDIVDNSPILGTLVYFVLTNGVNYGFYTAFKDNMNWPFQSEAAMYNQAAKISFSLVF